MRIWKVEEFEVEKNGETSLKHSNVFYIRNQDLVVDFLKKHHAFSYLGYDVPVRVDALDGFWFVRPEEQVETCLGNIVQPELRYEVCTIDVLEYV